MMSSNRSRWRALPALLAVCFLALMSLIPSLALAQDGPAPGSHAQVIAHGVDLMPRVEVAWRVTASEAAPADEAAFFDRTLGFAIGAGDPVLVTDDDTDRHVLLNDVGAAFHPEGASERRSSTTDETIDYINIELIVADAIDSPESVGTSRLTFAGDPFAAPRGLRDLQLVREVLAPEEEGEIAGTGDAPALLYVSDGALQVTDNEGEITELAAGDAMELTGDAALLAGASDGATWLLARIGDEVELPEVPATTPEPEAETGALELILEACADSLDADCTPITNRDVTVPAFHLIEDDGNWFIPDRADLSDDDTVLTYDDLPVGDYVTMPDDETAETVTIEGAAWDDDLEGWAFEIEPGETTELTLRTLVDDRDDTGSLLVTLYDCPAGTDPEADSSACSLATEPWDVSVADIGQTSTTEWTLANDALDLGDSQYWFELLPAGALTFYPDGAVEAGASDVAVTGDPYLLGNLWTVDIPYRGAAEATLYRVLTDDAPAEGAGSLYYGERTCPAGTDGLDLSACERASEPWDISFEHIDTGASYSTFADAQGNPDDGYWFAALPAGTYTVYGVNPSGDGQAYLGGDIEIGQDWPTITIEAGGEQEFYVYYVPAGEPDAPAGGTGSLVIYQSDCDYGTDPAVDTSACATSTDPWAVSVTNNDTGESWSLLADGVAYDSGTYVLEALPAGSYSIGVSANENWVLSYPTTVDVTADDETYVTIYSVDLRVP